MCVVALRRLRNANPSAPASQRRAAPLANTNKHPHTRFIDYWVKCDFMCKRICANSFRMCVCGGRRGRIEVECTMCDVGGGGIFSACAPNLSPMV